MRALLKAMTLALLVAGGVLALPGVASGETETFESVVVDRGGISIGYPESWDVIDYPADVDGLRAYLKQAPEAARMLGLGPDATDKELRRFINQAKKKQLLLAADVGGDGDNVIVALERGEWWTDLDEWRSYGKMVAKTTDASVLNDAETRVGGRQAFTHLEQDPRSAGGTIFGYMEIRAGKNASVSISITADGDSRATVEAIIQSVKAA